ncbi:threonine synthase [Helicobacter mesocricetorum]|uniref:threonine synthase n=1 Tax=Helicobacter mesocricetorum TaxID=87012 RepID=UPI000CF0C53F|nr:threonine synthase [Helicobacter mesocricetorum]
MQLRNFVGTRGGDYSVSFKDSVLNPNAPYGGLWTLEDLPKFSDNEMQSFVGMSYEDLAKKIFESLGLDIDKNLLHNALALYKKFDDKNTPAPLYKINKNLSIQKLYCGPTRAFKDMALQPFGEIFSAFLKDSSKEYLILVATSGDTGPATLESFANKDKIKVVCLYPEGGTSEIQRLQMTTIAAKNIKVIEIKGDFDDAQNLLKELLKDGQFLQRLTQNNLALSAANSVNFGRIAFQILYHIYASLQSFALHKKKTHIIIPSGNFGNALGAFYAKNMGFPIEKIWIASNANNILTDFIKSGVYDISHRILQKTYSPAMDILTSSNIERVLFFLFGKDRTKELMEDLQKHKKYALNQEELEILQTYFEATYCEDSYCLEKIREYVNAGFIIDPHTACGIKAYEAIIKSDNEAICILCSTAEWTKFAKTLSKALGIESLGGKQSLEVIASKYSLAISPNILGLFDKKEVHTQGMPKENVRESILEWLEGNGE